MTPSNKSQHKTTYLRDYTPAPYLVDTVDLHIDIRDTFVLVRSCLALRLNPQGDGSRDLLLDGAELELESISLEGRVLGAEEYQLAANSLTLRDMAESFTLEIVTRIFPKKNTSLEGLYLSNGIYCTQCESQGFRKITFFPDRPDVMAVFTTTIEADRSLPVLLANGNLQESGPVGEGRHFARWHDPFKKPSYLFATVAGELSKVDDTFKTASGRQVVLEIYVEPHNREKCGHALESLRHAMAWDERVFGLEYDLDRYMIVAVDNFNAGAMENKGLNVFNSKYILARPESATDDDYAGIEGVVAHEYFHNWTGNRVTCRDWFQLSLKEGLTVFRDQQFSGDMTSPSVKRIHDVAILRTHQFPEDAGPMAHPVRPESYIEINNFYTLTVYEKGAELIRMFYTLLGREGFRRGMDLYIERHDGQAVTTEDFAKAMADAYNAGPRPLGDIDFPQFALWYSQAGTPILQVAGEYDPKDKSYTLSVVQKAPANARASHKMMFIPLAMGLLDEGGRELDLGCGAKSATLKISKERQEFTFKDIPSRPVPSLLRGFSAPVILEYDYSDAELTCLLLHDSDPFCRWEAAQRFFNRRLLDLIASGRAGEEMRLSSKLSEICARMLAADFEDDKDFLALMLTTPSHSYLAELLDEIDPLAIHEARTFFRRFVAQNCRRELLGAYGDNLNRGPYRYDPQLAGRRRFKNLCLSYLALLDEGEIWELIHRQFREADNMSDELAALQAMVHGGAPQAAEVLGEFFEKWRHEPLVMDKWFTVQATAPTPAALDEVIRLTRHPLFAITNPNKVRALIGAFAAANPAAFHAADGGGYRFLVDKVLELDPLNPHIAARLLGNLSRWRKYEPKRQGLMAAELRRVIACKTISNGVFEVAEKSLGDEA